MAERVHLTQSQSWALLEKLGGDEEKLKRCIEKLSDWKLSKQMEGGNDYLAICKWVINAVENDPYSVSPDSAGAR